MDRMPQLQDQSDGTVVATVPATVDVPAAHAELASARAQIEHLSRALESNRRIGMAIGIVMARHGLTPDEAFGALRMASQRSHRKLRDIAEDVVFTGEIPAA